MDWFDKQREYGKTIHVYQSFEISKQEISEVNLAYEVGRKCPEDDSVCGRGTA